MKFSISNFIILSFKVMWLDYKWDWLKFVGMALKYNALSNKTKKAF